MKKSLLAVMLLMFVGASTAAYAECKGKPPDGCKKQDSKDPKSGKCFPCNESR